MAHKKKSTQNNTCNSQHQVHTDAPAKLTILKPTDALPDNQDKHTQCLRIHPWGKISCPTVLRQYLQTPYTCAHTHTISIIITTVATNINIMTEQILVTIN